MPKLKRTRNKNPVKNSNFGEQEELQTQKQRPKRNQKLTPVTVENSDSNEEIEEIVYHRNVKKGLVLGNMRILNNRKQ